MKIVVSILLISFFILLYFKSKKPNNITYYKNNIYVITKILQDVLDKNNFKRINNSTKSTIYIPDTYTFIDYELNNFKITNKNQYIFGFDSCDILAGKNYLWNLLEDNYGRQFANKIMPDTYVLNNTEHIDLFKKNYNPKSIYILKKNLQRKEGILLTSDYKKIKKIMQNLNSEYVIIQNYIKNVFLINQYKLNLRIYLLIIYKNNKYYSYVYKNGKCMYTNKKYNEKSLDLEENITSLNLNKDLYNQLPIDLLQLEEYFNKHNLNYNRLFSNIYNNIKLLHNCYINKLLSLGKLKETTSFQLFGLDYIINNNLDVFLLEINKGPQMGYVNTIDYNLKFNLLEDIFNKLGLFKNKKKNLFLEIL